MNPEPILDRLARFPQTLHAICRGLPRDDALYRADAKSWSILEVVCHLVDEEASDFPKRLASTLRDPSAPWDPFDPQGLAIERRYREQDLTDQLGRFVQQRADNIAWARTLQSPDWELTYDHPEIGPLRAGDLLTAWGAHDALHLRQISKRLYETTLRDGGEFRVDYAGGW